MDHAELKTMSPPISPTQRSSSDAPRLVTCALLLAMIVSSGVDAAAPAREPGANAIVTADGASAEHANVSALVVSSNLTMPDGRELDVRRYHSAFLALNATAGSEGITPGHAASKLNATAGALAATAADNYGWLSNLSTTAWLNLNLPFGVVFGDSIARGLSSPSGTLYGRLENNGASPTYDETWANQPGQLSDELGRTTGLHWYNHGIAGQNTSQLWARWARDVLGQTSDAGDGRPTKTLPDKPYVVVVSAAHNDVFRAQNNLSAPETKANLLRMAKSAREHDISAVFLAIGPRGSNSETNRTQAADINAWMKATLPRYGARVVDTLQLLEDPAQPGTFEPDPALTYDTHHPNKAGYSALARAVTAALAGQPVYLHGVVIESVPDPDDEPTAWSRPKEVTATVGGSSVRGVLENKEHTFLPLRTQGTSRTLNLTVHTGHTVTGGSYVGISKVRAFLSDVPAPSGEPNILTSGHQVWGEDTRVARHSEGVLKITRVSDPASLRLGISGVSVAGISFRTDDAHTVSSVHVNVTGVYAGAGGSSSLDTGLLRPAANVWSVEADDGLRLGNYAGACSSTTSGVGRHVPGGAGVADKYEICGKNAADVYSWQTIYTFT